MAPQTKILSWFSLKVGEATKTLAFWTTMAWEWGLSWHCGQAWRVVSSCPPMVKVMRKIEACQTHLKWWSKKSICNISRTLVEKKESLKESQGSSNKGGNMDFFFQLKIKVNDFFEIGRKNVAAALDTLFCTPTTRASVPQWRWHLEV